MTLNEIVAASLGMLDRGTDAQTIETYEAKFTIYANTAIKIIAEAFRPERQESIECDNGFSLNDLSRACIAIKSIMQNGREIRFDISDRVRCAARGTVNVRYAFYPLPLSSATDRPELPEPLHGLIPEYVAARELGNDGNAVMHYQEFNRGLAKIPQRTFCFKNMW